MAAAISSGVMQALNSDAAPQSFAGPGDRAFKLTAACCRPAGLARDNAVRFAAEGVDWDSFGRIVVRHRVEGLAYEALRRADVEPDPAVASDLRRAAMEIAAGGLRLAAESQRLQGALDKAAIPNLVLKGTTLDQLVWGRLGLKRAWDIDLLVTPGDARVARACLEAADYRLMDPPNATPEVFAAWVSLSKESVFRRPDGNVTAELHWRLTDIAGLLPGLSSASPSQLVALPGGLVLRTLAPEELFAYLCVHGATHAWSRLKWLADLGGLLAAEDDAGRTRLYERAVALGAGRCPASALLLCETLFGIPLPSTIAHAIRADAGARWLAALALDAMAGAGDAEIETRRFFNDRVILSQLLFAPGWRFRLAEAARQSVSLDDKMTMRLPPSLGFVYPLVRVPLWLWRRLGRRDGFKLG